MEQYGDQSHDEREGACADGNGDSGDFELDPHVWRAHPTIIDAVANAAGVIIHLRTKCAHTRLTRDGALVLGPTTTARGRHIRDYPARTFLAEVAAAAEARAAASPRAPLPATASGGSAIMVAPPPPPSPLALSRSSPLTLVPRMGVSMPTEPQHAHTVFSCLAARTQGS